MSDDGAKVVIIASTPYLYIGTKRRSERLDRREVHPRDAAIEVEGIDIRHPRDLVQRALDASVHRGLPHLILATYATEKRAAVLVVGVKLCLEELVEEGGEDTMPCELDVDDLTSPIDAGIGRLATRLVGCLRAWLEVMDEATGEGPR